MMQTAKHWQSDDFAQFARTQISILLPFRNTLVDALIWPRPVEVCQVLVEHTSQVSLAHDHDVVEVVSANTAHLSPADRIRARGSDRRSEHLNSASNCDGSKCRPYLASLSRMR